MAGDPAEAVLAVDPGRAKCGIAVVSTEGVLAREVCPSEYLVVRVRALLQCGSVMKICVGSGTNGRRLARALSTEVGFPPVELVDERFSTLDAKKRYFAQNPSRGIRRLIPESLQTPPEPIDDWVAVILAERALGIGKA